MDSVDHVRSRVMNNVSVTYNILGKNKSLMNELRAHAVYLNKLSSSLGLLQEAKIAIGFDLRFRFEGDVDTAKFYAQAEVLKRKILECSSLNVLSLPTPSERVSKNFTLDNYHHPELDEKDIIESKNRSKTDSPTDHHSNSLSSPKITSPIRRLRQPPKLFEENNLSKLDGDKSSHMRNAKKHVSEHQELALISEIFTLLQQKAFISDSYAPNLPEIDKLELILRLCKGYH